MNVAARAQRFAALGDPVRLAIVDDLVVSDRAPAELAARHGIPSNLLAHHLAVLENAGLVTRLASAGDRRRKYVRLQQGALGSLHIEAVAPDRPVLFVCTRNSARSQLAAAMWREKTGSSATSAGTHPADCVHPGAVAAALRAGFEVGGWAPRSLTPGEVRTHQVITVCDSAHEELRLDSAWHWSIADPAESGTPASFDRARADIEERIDAMRGDLR